MSGLRSFFGGSKKTKAAASDSTMPTMQPGLQKTATPIADPTGVTQQAFVKRTFSGLNEINDSQIDRIVDLAPGHPVFRIVFFNGMYDMVVKAETVATPGPAKLRYNATASTMSVISKAAISETISTQEMNELKLANGRGKASAEFGRQLKSPQIWVKMKFRSNLTDLQKPDVDDGFSDAQKTSLRNLMPKLVGNKNAWFTLGEVVIADFFVGNGDRARWSPEVKKRDGSIVPTAASVGNPGNFFFKLDAQGNVKKAIALDNFDPFGGATGTLHDNDIGQWKSEFGPLLGKNKSLRLDFARNLVGKIVEHAGDAGVVVAFDQGEAGYFAKGMDSGISKLKTRLVAESKNKVNKANIPVGVTARMQFLQWI